MMALHSRLPEIAASLEAAVLEGVKAGAELVRDSAKERVPVESGRLRDAIHVEETPDGAAVVAGDREAFYGHMVEHGTTHSPPHPFLVPALEENRVNVQTLASEALRKATGR